VLDLAAIEHARLLVIASPDGFQVPRTLELARERNPRIAIVVRTHSASELEYLIGQGVDRAVMGELELALEMTDYALRSLGVSETARRWSRNGCGRRKSHGRSEWRCRGKKRA
jgi:CPA2 family monovalent cation:H+ antiporter-2